MRPKRPVDLPEGFSSEHVLRTIARIVGARETIDFMTVARAMVLKASLGNPRTDGKMADSLGIPRQTAHKWLHEDLGSWLQRWESRLAAVERRAPPPAKRRERITEPEWSWIAKVLSQQPAKSWGKRAWAVKRAAGRDPIYGHLVRISRSTLFKNRNKIGRFQAVARAGAANPKEGTSASAKESGKNERRPPPTAPASQASARDEDPF